MMLLNVFFLVKFLVRFLYNFVFNYVYSFWIKDGESYIMFLGLWFCLRIEWVYIEIFLKFLEVSYNNIVFIVEYYGYDC